MRENEQAWMEQNCAKYGFVVRYDGSKFEKTGILDESWHYRYVGVPHATYMMENNLCLEEYLELLKNSYAYPNEPLTVSANDTGISHLLCPRFLGFHDLRSGSCRNPSGPMKSPATTWTAFIVTVTKK